jgi:hypothetical protein
MAALPAERRLAHASGGSTRLGGQRYDGDFSGEKKGLETTQGWAGTGDKSRKRRHRVMGGV